MTIQMPHGSSTPLPSRTVRSMLFSQVSGASSRRSSARPLAPPRTSSIVPSVMMNGTTRRPVMSTPFINPHTAPAAIAPAAATSGHDPSRRNCAVTTVLSAMTEPDRQIDPARHDHHRHAQRGNAHDGGLARHELEIGCAEELRTDEESEEERDEREPREHAGILKARLVRRSAAREGGS